MTLISFCRGKSPIPIPSAQSSLGPDSCLTLPAVKSTQVPQVNRMVIGNEERCAVGGTPLSITSHSSNTSSGLANIDLTQEMLDKESRGKLKGKIRQIENKLKKEREFLRAILANYKDETMLRKEKTRYRMIYTGISRRLCSMKSSWPILVIYRPWKTFLLLCLVLSNPTVSPTPCSTSQVPPQGTAEVGCPSAAKWDAVPADALAAVQQITQPFPPNIMHHLRIYLSDRFWWY